MSRYASYHPAVAALHLLSVLLITMFTVDPLWLSAALLGGIAFSLTLEKPRHPLKTGGAYLLLFLLVSLTNPLFSHDGVTPLFFLNGNPVTLEAVLYGADLAVMLMAVIGWFRCFDRVITGDKLLFLCGKLSPKLSLLLSSALRFVPLLKDQAGRIRQAQTAMGLYASDSRADRLRSVVRVCSALITWALEKAIDTGSSMKARGYGSARRTHYAFYRFKAADGVLLGVVLLLDGIVLAAMATGRTAFTFYPALSAPPVDGGRAVATAAFVLLTFLPVILEGKERILWRYYRSGI